MVYWFKVGRMISCISSLPCSSAGSVNKDPVILLLSLAPEFPVTFRVGKSLMLSNRLLLQNQNRLLRDNDSV